MSNLMPYVTAQVVIQSLVTAGVAAPPCVNCSCYVLRWKVLEILQYEKLDKFILYFFQIA